MVLASLERFDGAWEDELDRRTLGGDLCDFSIPVPVELLAWQHMVTFRSRSTATSASISDSCGEE